jgi:tetratricopeptide (TPR) repeat protein
MGALDELLGKWRENPDTGTTLALCTYLGTSKREELIREVGSTSEAWHKDDPQVMLAVGRMYLDAGLLPESQAALVAAGKLVPDNASAYRYLGEVLLRRGDAARAEKVLARALQIGSVEPDTRMWHDRAVVYLPLQNRVGMQAVADDVDKTIPRQSSFRRRARCSPIDRAGEARRFRRLRGSRARCHRSRAQNHLRLFARKGRRPIPRATSTRACSTRISSRGGQAKRGDPRT